ncbi:replication protein A 70 kDa DNA-binding subunit B [Tanacetum coccineum]
MDQNITQLCDLDPMLGDLKIVARCISVWKPHPVGNPKDVWSLDYVLQDAQLLLDEGSCYRIANFGVGDNGGKFPLINHKYKVNLFKNTSVTRLPIIDNNPCGFKFELFPNFHIRQFAASDVVDLIGTVVSISDFITYNNSGEDKIRRNLILEDVEGRKMDCCFFDGWAAKFDNLYLNREKMGQLVMILQLAKVKYFNDSLWSCHTLPRQKHEA